MAGSVDKYSEPELKRIFNEAWHLFKEIEKHDGPSNSELFQEKIKKCIKLFSEATCMVNILELFSKNEEIEEISTPNLRYLLLPAFLGELTLLEMSEERFSNVSRAKVYFEDFFQRCKDYGVTQKDISMNATPSGDTAGRNYQRNLVDRQAKINRYKEVKELKSALETLENRLKVAPNSVDDEVEREYYLSWIRLWINESIEKLSLIKSELEILEHMKNIQSGKIKPAEEKQKAREPMKPILITKDSLRSKVFGAGYPSLPSITPEEWMERQIAEGKVVLDFNPNVNSVPDEKESSDEDDDSEEKLKKARDWDEWKDDHRRGEGNRISRG